MLRFRVAVVVGAVCLAASGLGSASGLANVDAEFRAAPPGTADFRPRVSVAYREVLGRADGGDPGGLLGWHQEMVAGKTEAEIREIFLRHPDYALTHQLPNGSVDYSPVVILAYIDFLGGVDPVGVAIWTQHIINGVSEARMREYFLRDPGYTSRHRLSDGSVDYSPIINLWYVRILGRVGGGEAAGVAEWNRRMNAGLTEDQLRESFIRSQEYASKHPAPPTGEPKCTRANQGATASYMAEVNTAIDQYIVAHPSSFSNNGVGTQVLGDPNVYIQGVAANLNAAGLIARQDPEGHDEIQVKQSNAFSDQYDVLAETTTPPTVRRFFAATCRPAAF